jgi:signal transduction histidine kinase
MSASGGTLRIQVRKSRANIRDAGEREGVEVRIQDSGPGIPLELREQIFNPFVTTKKAGVGLGLSIVSKIIDGHHGTIRIESSRIESGQIEGSGNTGNGGQGASFVIFFPAASSETLSSAQPAHLVIS